MATTTVQTNLEPKWLRKYWIMMRWYNNTRGALTKSKVAFHLKWKMRGQNIIRGATSKNKCTSKQTVRKYVDLDASEKQHPRCDLQKTKLPFTSSFVFFGPAHCPHWLQWLQEKRNAVSWLPKSLKRKGVWRPDRKAEGKQGLDNVAFDSG